MDSRQSLTPPPLHHQTPPGIIMQQNTYSTLQDHHPINKNPILMTPSSSSVQLQQPFTFNSSDHYVDGGFRAGGYTVDPDKKKRGRPRKYSASPDGSIALSLSPVNDGSGGTLGMDSSGKRHRGRPAGSVKKQLDALGVPGIGFTPHVITVKEGEDIASTMVSFSLEGPRTICILSANGAISNVTLQQSAISGGTVTYEGRFEIISLSGSFVYSESDGSHSKPSGLSVSLAGSDGRVLGGGVAGVLVAASTVQVIVGSFIADGKKSKSGNGPSSPVAPPNVLSFGGGGGTVPGISPPSDGHSSDSSDESGSSPVDVIPGSYNNANQQHHQHQQQQQQQQQAPMQNLTMYANMGWPGSTMNMLPN